METNVNTNSPAKVNVKFKQKTTRKESIGLWISRIIIWVCIIVLLFPVVWILGASFGKGNSFFSGTIFPKQWTFDNYRQLFIPTETLNFPRAMGNSMIVCTSVALLQLFMTGTAAYAFSRMRFTGRKYGLMALLLIQMFPSGMSVSAIYIILYKLKAIDNLFALILFLTAGSAFNIWLLKGYIDGLPIELDEAAKVDGASHWQVFTKIIVPLAAPMFAVIFLFSFIGTYSEFMISSVALQNQSKETVAIVLNNFIYNSFNQHWTQFAAASVISCLPLMIIFMVLQKYIQGGLVAGSVKG